MRKGYDPKEPMSLEERIFRQARTEDLFDDGVQTAPTLDEMVILNTSPNTRRRYSRSVRLRQQITRAGNLRTHSIKSDSWASTVLLTCSGMCTYAFGSQSLEGSGHINGVFDPIVDKTVNLVDSEMTVVKGLTEDLVRVIMIGVRTGSNVLQATGTLPDPSSWTDHLHAPRHDLLRLPQAQRPDPHEKCVWSSGPVTSS
ncbi:hypothetical protein FPCIR_10802 [Fusarium pseudocircinatum]|uniref:Uncharacterized protein n=1 Tax=Fusarium pseudocircinatum TaxID=56676 RepID=A0A8H5KU65_9HYPO|nr:hypothetical protein FPCIR_10802 [Fusarium pseudocircinatum]